MRLVHLRKLLSCEDELYYVVLVGLWGIGEITAGFLIIGIPAISKVVQSIQSSHSFISLVSRFKATTLESTTAPSRDKPKLRTWGKGSGRKPRGAWEISDVDTYASVSVQAEGVPNETERERLPKGIIRETRVDVDHSTEL